MYNRMRADALDVLTLSIAGALSEEGSKALMKEARKLRG